jgi:hypothetical protein
MSFWAAATEQAGREFGARHWRWFAGARVVRRVAPWAGVAVIAAAIVWGYRLISPDWGAVGASVAGFAPDAGRWLLIGGGAAAVLALSGWAAVALWRANSWRWSRF